VYLRFTPQEFRAIWSVCRPLRLSSDFFPVFKYFLVESLAETEPRLAGKVSHFNRKQTRLLFEYLRERQRSTA
jgi:hypothetical protein